ncbi:hypothetical protein RclHR1_01130012 [Rhizophagus clarus]|uniref:F-box domain-containing protein n=1 Tax=Rhizophagus clarus TaxID=94130 RepID=A0A2Z6Q438_9GLOM|nr:hypothetical protein RclHR1_01130012 [Rhizophagus clarus]
MVKDLPRELWLEIFKHFIVSFGVMELYKYRKVCKQYYEIIQILGGSSNNTEEEIKPNTSPPPSPSSHSSTQQTTNSFISYNYNTESFEYNFITTLKNDNEGKKKENIKKKYNEFCIIFHLIYEILNVASIKRIREYLIDNYWLNIEENIVDDSKYFQKIIVRGDKLLPYIDYIDQIGDLIGYLNNLTTR